MRLLYTLGILCFGWLIRLAAPFNPKARLWVEGRRDLFRRLEEAFRGHDRDKHPVAWFHAASLGEFEQGRPVIGAYRKKFPEHRVLLTFYSPSGYEVRRNYDQADWVFYLPQDTQRNARRFLEITRPAVAFFIKYDFWFNLLNGLHLRQVPVYYISVLLRPGHFFFKPFGGWFRRQLDAVTTFFVQDKETAGLLKSIGRENVVITGDTRFDRVYELALQGGSLPLIERFKGDNRVFVCGSTWKEDEDLVIPFVNRTDSGLKVIIAPHDTSAERVKSITDRLERPFVLLSQLDDNNAGQAGILVVDSVGILARLYRYATMAYIGGAFGAGLHNIQEPVTFGVPVFFGKNFEKFREAADLVALGGAFSVTETGTFEKTALSILSDEEAYSRISAICKHYVDEHRGATGKVMEWLVIGLR